jgi:hypothetical protein
MVKSRPEHCRMCRVDQLSKEPSTSTWLPPWLPAATMRGAWGGGGAQRRAQGRGSGTGGRGVQEGPWAVPAPGASREAAGAAPAASLPQPAARLPPPAWPLTHDHHGHKLGLRWPGLQARELGRHGSAEVVDGLHGHLGAVGEGGAWAEGRRAHRHRLIRVAILHGALRLCVALRQHAARRLRGARGEWPGAAAGSGIAAWCRNAASGEAVRLRCRSGSRLAAPP